MARRFKMAGPEQRRRRVVLTGAWLGGKSAFIQSLQNDDAISRSILVLPEAAPLARQIGFDPGRRDYERHVVSIQHALEEAVEDRAPGLDQRVVITHRGSLDALGFYRWRGDGDEGSFFGLIDSSLRQELARYDAVILFQSTASGALATYRRCSQVTCRPGPREAMALERCLLEAWRRHPNFHLLENRGVTWKEKAARAREIVDQCL